MTEPIVADNADLAQAGRDAFARHDWSNAYDLLSAADQAMPLSGSDLEGLAVAAFFAAKADQRIAITERAFKAYQAEGDVIRSAFVALNLADNLMLKGKNSLAAGWARRAEQILEGQPESYAHAYLVNIRANVAKGRGDLVSAMALATEAAEIAKRTGNPDVRAMALTTVATLKIATGDATEGFALLEEAAFSAVNGELSPMTAGVASCQMISACRDLTDYQRAIEWIEATDQWCERQEVSGFPGICRVHRAEIVALRGGWDRAEEELRKATKELEAFEAFPPMADGLYALGEIRRLKGDFEGAEEALRQAHTLGRSPQPAMALIRLNSGNAKSAGAAINAALAEPNWDQWARARLLAAQVEISIAAGEVGPARESVNELKKIVAGYPSPALEAGMRQASGNVLLAEADPTEAIREFRAALKLWREVGGPYEVAKTQVLLARALRAIDDEDGADLELAAAREAFERLGARPDLTAAEAEVRDVALLRGQRRKVRRTFMFTDIVGSTRLAESLGDEAWEQLLGWHDQTLRRLIAAEGGQVVNTTGDGFFAAFETPAAAIACAVAIQRALAERQGAEGSAPPVRIGLHSTEATQRGNDYSGIGVHMAARIAALAQGEEILISTDSLGDASDVRTSAMRDVELRGISASSSVAAIEWAD
jgi:class 3 adenylate cyclase/ATP/maltotriose-dependent transcriptional regulator MalT